MRRWRGGPTRTAGMAAGLALAMTAWPSPGADAPPVRLAIVGLVHGHVRGFLSCAISRSRRLLRRPARGRGGHDRRGPPRRRRDLHEHVRSSEGRRGLRGPRRARGDDGEAARRLHGSCAPHRGGGAARPHAGPRELRDDLVPEQPRGLPRRAARRARARAQDGRPRRAPRAARDRRPAGVPGLAHRPRPRRRWRPDRLRLLRREPVHLAHGQRAPEFGGGGDADLQALRLRARRRRGHHRRRLARGRGHHPGLVELALGSPARR